MQLKFDSISERTETYELIAGNCSDEQLHQQFETNFFGAMKMVRCVLPHFRKIHAGTFLFMGSIGGWLAAGVQGAYSASKFALEGQCHFLQDTKCTEDSLLGAAESLAKETTHLGIRTHILVLGSFRTNILDAKRKGGTLSPGIADYDSVRTEIANRHDQSHRNQPGDPARAAQRIVDVARLENLTEGQKKNLTLRVPLGYDALRVISSVSTDALESLKAWEDFAASTDFAVTADTVVMGYK